MLDVQTAGSLAVIGAFAASEGSARLLDAFPASPMAWYLNLEVFRPFELARAAITPLSVFFGPGALYVDVLLIVAILAVRVLRFRFGIAFLSNLSFGIAAALAHAWLLSASAPRTASLLHVSTRPVSENLVVGTLLAASFVAFVVSHASFLVAVRLSPDVGRAMRA